MRIALCEDEKMHAVILQEIIQRWSTSQEQSNKIKVYESAEAFLKDFEDGAKFDLAFFDIRLGGMTGLDLAKLIRQRNTNMLIVFVTNFFDYVFEGYEVSAFRYLLKPIKEKKMMEALAAANEICRKRSAGYYTVITEETTYKIKKSEIIYFATQDHYIHVHTVNGTHRFRGKMSQLDDEFAKPMFAKCNRGILINVVHISSIHKDRVNMVNKENLPLSRVYWEDLNRCYIAVHVNPLTAKMRQTTCK